MVNSGEFHQHPERVLKYFSPKETKDFRKMTEFWIWFRKCIRKTLVCFSNWLSFWKTVKFYPLFITNLGLYGLNIQILKIKS